MTTLQVIREVTIRGRTEGVAQATGELNALKVAHEGVARTTETTARSTLSVERAMDRWQRTLDATFRAEQMMTKVTRDLDRAMEQEIITLDRRNELLALAEQRYRGVTPPLQDSSQAMALSTFQMQNMTFQLNDMAMMLATGASPFVVMTQQGMQMAQVFGPGVGLRGAISATGAALMAFVTNPINLAVLGLASATGAATLLWDTLSDGSADSSDALDQLGREIDALGLRMDVTKASGADLAVALANLAPDEVRQRMRAAQEAMDAVNGELADLRGELMQTALVFERTNGGIQEASSAAARDVMALVEGYQSGSIGASDLLDRLRLIAAADLTPGVDGLLARLRTAIDRARELGGYMDRFGAPNAAYDGFVDATFMQFDRSAARERLAAELERMNADERRAAERAQREAEREAERERRDNIRAALDWAEQVNNASLQAADEVRQFWRGTTGAIVSDLRGALQDGKITWQEFADVAVGAIGRITDRLLNDLLDALYQVNKGGGGIFSFLGGGGAPVAGGNVSGAVASAMARGAGGLFADGAAFAGGEVVPFASGGIVDRPVIFPMARGAGLMGEAGPEAIMPLRRGSDGRLGVSAAAGAAPLQVNVYEAPGVQMDVQRGDDGSLDIKAALKPMFEEMFADTVGRNGNGAQVLENTYALRKAPRARRRA